MSYRLNPMPIRDRLTLAASFVAALPPGSAPAPSGGTPFQRLDSIAGAALPPIGSVTRQSTAAAILHPLEGWNHAA